MEMTDSKIGWGIGMILVLLGASGKAMADHAARAPAEGPEDHPCKKIEEACKEAGFAKGAWKEGKGLFKNCMGPLMHGQSVPGVSVDAAAVQACQARKAKWKERHPHEGHEGHEGTEKQGEPKGEAHL